MKLVALALNLPNVVEGFLHKLSEKGPNFKPMIIDVKATSGLKS